MQRIFIFLFCCFSLTSFGQHPTNLYCTNITSDAVSCHWTNNGCTNLLKFRALDSTSNGTWVLITSNVSNPFLLNNLQSSTNYEWKVKCSGISGWSNSSFFTTLDSTNCNFTTTTTSINTTCNNSYNGSATINIINGVTPFSYIWNTGDTTSSLNNIQSGSYIVTSTDSSGCSVIDTILVASDNLISLSQSITPFIDTTNPNYPNTVQAHNIWVYDTLTLINNGCDVNIRPEFTISHQDSIIQQGQIKIHWKSPVGFINIPYNINSNGDAHGFWNTYSSDSTGIIATMYSTNEILLRVQFTLQAPFGEYTALWDTKEVDSLGNILQIVTPYDTATLTLVDCNSFLPHLSYSNISCWGDSNGIASIDSISNGSGNYTYNWINDTIPGIPFAATASVQDLPTGNYSCTIIDSSLGCSIIESFTISEPAPLNIIETTTDVICYGDSNGTAILGISGGTNPYGEGWYGYSSDSLQAGIWFYYVTDANSCTFSDSVIISQPPQLTSGIISTDITNCTSNNGTIDLNPNGGTGILSFSWSNGATSEDLFNLSPGTYYVTISDTSNCSTIDSAIINDYTSIISTTLSSPTFNGYNIQCFGNNNGTVTSNTNGGVGILSYFWSDGQTSSTASNLSPGMYTLTVTDSLGCTDTDSITLTEPNELTSSYTQTNVSCFGVNDGSAIVNFFGGTIGTIPGDTNYILGWDGFTTVLYNPITEFQTAGVSPSGVPAGVYPYSATDLNGCTIYDTITITQPDSLYIAYSTTNYNGFEISCNGLNDGEINIQINGGTNPFDNYLNGVLQSNLIYNNLSPGTYFDSIVDANGCSATNTIILNEPTDLISALDSLNISCNGVCSGEITSNTSGGVLPYSYSWTSIQDTTANVANLCAGYYSLSVTDANGCIENLSTTITEPNPITILLDSTSNISTYGGNDGYIYISSNGGSGQLTVGWSSDNGFSSSNEDISNLAAGFYYLAITDINSCTSLDTFELSQPTSLWINLDNVINANCYSYCNGSINITANGGDSTYSYSWVGPNGFLSNNDDISNLCYGEYIITINDGISSLVDTFNVYQPQPITSTLTADSILCHNGTAQAEINVWGGTQPFTYNWSNGDSNYFTTFSSGSHSIIVTDTNGCTLSQSFNLSNPDSIFADTTVINTNCFGTNNGSIIINITNGGTTPFTFSIDNGITYQSSNTFSNLFPGNYSFLIADINGCLGSTSAEITEPTEMTSTTSSTNASCYEVCDGSVFASALGGTPPYIYNWDNGTTNLCAGFYNLIITDGNGCIISNSAIVSEPDPLLINIWINGNTIHATSGFISYQWFDNNNPIVGATDSIFTPTGAGIYYVSVTDTIGCNENSYIVDYHTSSIENYSFNTKIFPNPTNGNITISSEYIIESVSVFNAIGNQLLVVNNNNGTQTDTKIDLSTFAKGVYFIKISINNQIINQRIILQ